VCIHTHVHNDILTNSPYKPSFPHCLFQLSTELSITKRASKSHDYHESADDYAILEYVNKMDIKSTTEVSLSKVHAQDRAQCRSVPLSSSDSDKSEATTPPVFDDEDRISVITQTRTDEETFGIESVRSYINRFSDRDHGVNKHLHTHDCTMLCLVSQDSGTTCLINAVIKEDWPCCHGL